MCQIRNNQTLYILSVDPFFSLHLNCRRILPVNSIEYDAEYFRYTVVWANQSLLFDIQRYSTEIRTAFVTSTIIGLFGFFANLLLLIVIVRLDRHNADGASHILIANLVLVYLLSCL